VDVNIIRALHAGALAFLALCCARPMAAAEPPAPTTLVIRIYDYACIPPAIVQAAERFVDDTYRNIGVQIDWAETLPLDRPRAAAAGMPDPRELVIVILNQAMAERRAFPPDVIGTAAVAIHEGGRVAYVLADRLWQVAGSAERDAVSVMGLVMAHELGHLLLPMGAHSPTGVMRPHWRMKEIQDSRDPGLFQFTSFQAGEIRDFLVSHGE
jgi:hypothetical protein